MARAVVEDVWFGHKGLLDCLIATQHHRVLGAHTHVNDLAILLVKTHEHAEGLVGPCQQQVGPDKRHPRRPRRKIPADVPEVTSSPDTQYDNGDCQQNGNVDEHHGGAPVAADKQWQEWRVRRIGEGFLYASGAAHWLWGPTPASTSLVLKQARSLV